MIIECWRCWSGCDESAKSRKISYMMTWWCSNRYMPHIDDTRAQPSCFGAWRLCNIMTWWAWYPFHCDSVFFFLLVVPANTAWIDQCVDVLDNKIEYIGEISFLCFPFLSLISEGFQSDVQRHPKNRSVRRLFDLTENYCVCLLYSSIELPPWVLHPVYLNVHNQPSPLPFRLHSLPGTSPAEDRSIYYTFVVDSDRM